MNETLYFGISSFLLYTFWYGSLGWFVPDPTQRQGSLHFWTRNTVLHDMPRETPNQKHKPVRRIAYPRLVLALAMCSGIFYLTTAQPIKVEAQFFILVILALLTPVMIVVATYRELLLRLIPLFWGCLLGLCAIAGFVTRTKPWNFDLALFLTNLMNPHTPKAVLATSLVGIVGFVTATMAAGGYAKPANWFAWCIVTMAVGSTSAGIGLLVFKVI